ncbi:kinase-like domain-containing protein [Russula earlei]|uniref:Kinase-like domain-containing protein n=1 Tax=Russula earlei TaxID=71964 RepID=A0ACC0UC23_9AGAM|nr:kinase-like domain-containing protein [Russula earlei]
MSHLSATPPRAPPVQYNAHHGTRWQKEKAAAGHGAFDYPEDAKYVGPWVIGECVGKGASGHVKIARHRRTGQLAAIKILPLDFVFGSRTSLNTRQAKVDKQRLGIDREIIMMKLMNHPNIMRIYDVYEGDKELYLILEYVEGGELFDFLVNRGKLSPLDALAYFKQIIYGLNYAHAFSIIHRDLKPENILIHSLNPPLIKIADWGMAAFAPPSLELETSCGSPHYASPEIVHGHKYSGTATDIWSCGVILFALLTGRLPFDDKNFKTGKYDMPVWVEPQAQDLISRMLTVDASQRITIPEILLHPWFTQYTPGILYVPAPTVVELARPLPSAAHIDPDVFEYLSVIWGRYADPRTITTELLSPAGSGTLTKAFYFLLLQHRTRTLEERGIFMDIDESSLLNARGEKFVNRLYMAPLSKKNRPLSADSTPARTTEFVFLPPHMSDDRTTAPPAYQPSWAQQAQACRTRPSSPAGPRGHRPRPISSPPPAHSHIHTSFASANVTHPSNPSSPSHTRAFYGGPRSPPSTAYAEQFNPFIAPVPARPHEHTTGFMVPLSPISPSVLSGTLPPVSAPRISNATFQRTIDDIAGRMNVLNAAFARAQIQARADAAQAQAQARYRGLPMLGQYPAPCEAEPDKVPTHAPVVSGGDKENTSVEQGMSGRRRPSAGYTADDGQLLSGLGFGKANGGIGVLRKEIGNITVPPEAVTGTRTKKDRKGSKPPPPPPTLDIPDSPSTASPVLGSPKSSFLSSPAVGEVKGWFSSLFHWRTHALAMHSRDAVAPTRAELRRLLAPVLLPAPQPDGALRARIEDAYDPVMGHVVQKAVRFRVEFTIGGGGGPDSPSGSGLGSGCSGRGGGCTMTFVQEKGSVSAFRAVCARLRAEWMLNALEPLTPGVQQNGIGSDDADARLVSI